MKALTEDKPAVLIRTNPSLALVKYWGKCRLGHNRPATSSLALSLAGLTTTTELRLLPAGAVADQVTLGGQLQPAERFAAFFDQARRLYRHGRRYQAVSVNDFPSAAGLASSSSGLAALALGCAALAGRCVWPAASPVEQPAASIFSAGQLRQASALARLGSASAARAVYGGWTWLPAGGAAARALHDAAFWPDFRVLVVVTTTAAKSASSRGAMNRTRANSPYYPAWRHDAVSVSREARLALYRRDLERLGQLARLSYSRMHASALAADPPLLYWLPASLVAIQCCAELRLAGIGAWETMDAGPQVKILCEQKDLAAIRAALAAALPAAGLIETSPAAGPSLAAWSPGLAAGSNQP
jgi:diphosphomevalonate decarboxylase